MKDYGKPDASRDHGGADQRKIYCALIDGKGEDVIDGLHDDYILSLQTMRET